ncbi:DUF1499 domain-containing protein [Pelagibius litoralis]|uniref:DUF1499 domain-containing protein n=1 Tax=Pelagibius litoralis TaxID=374515 RepID=A0A967F0M0_9PROT|nr:DUF1499 domain-containing protein [Pelagibius litoralis]NIA70806.1 DUF1499 domain-containing protein [Pelagibius litoralis]
MTPEDWHVDPVTIEKPDTENHFLLRPQGGDGPAPVFQASPDAVVIALQEVIDETPRATVIDGSPGARHMTILVRSKLVGFPDFVTVKVLAADSGTAIAIFSRSQYGKSDLGVNKARVENWVKALETRLRK